MDSILHDFSSMELARAYDANEVAFWTLLFGQFPGAQLHDDDGLLWFETGLRYDVFNRVIHGSLAPETCSVAIERVVDYFRQHRIPFLWHRGPSSLANLGKHLEGGGMTHYETEPAMAVDLLGLNEDLPVTTQLTTTRVTTYELLEQWIRVWEFGNAEEVMGLWIALYANACLAEESPLRLYLGLLDGEAVATAGVFLGAEVATIGPVGTLPNYRRRGIGAAMTLLALHEVRRHGYRISVLTASPMGITTYRRIGFQEFGTSSIYLWHPPY